MAKAVKKKDAKEASNIFHNIMAASIKGNPKPIKKKNMQDKYEELYLRVQDEMIKEGLIKESLMEISSMLMNAEQKEIKVEGLIGTPIEKLAILKNKLNQYSTEYGFTINIVNFTTPK